MTVAFQPGPSFVTLLHDGDQSDNPMTAYYADHAAQHARRCPGDAQAQQVAAYWQAQLVAQQLKLQQRAAAYAAPAPGPAATSQPTNPYAMPPFASANPASATSHSGPRVGSAVHQKQ